MSQISYDLNKLRSQNVPPASLEDWMQLVMCTDLKTAYWKMRSFIDRWGKDVFWAYKDTQNAAKVRQDF